MFCSRHTDPYSRSRRSIVVQHFNAIGAGLAKDAQQAAPGKSGDVVHQILLVLQVATPDGQLQVAGGHQGNLAEGNAGIDQAIAADLGFGRHAYVGRGGDLVPPGIVQIGAQNADGGRRQTVVQVEGIAAARGTGQPVAPGPLTGIGILDPPDVGIQVGVLEIGDHALEEHRGQIQLGPADAGPGGVEEGDLADVLIIGKTQLHVVVVHREHSEVGAQPVVQPLGLVAYLDGVHQLFIHLLLEDAGQLGPAIEAPGAITLGVFGIGAGGVADIPGGDQGVGPVVPAMAGSLVTEALSSDIACAIPANLALVFRIARPGGEMEPVVEDGRRPGELAVSGPGAVLHPGLAVLQVYVHRIVADHLLCRLLEVVQPSHVVETGPIQLTEELELLAELILVRIIGGVGKHVRSKRVGAVVLVEPLLELTVAGQGFDGQRVRGRPLRDQAVAADPQVALLKGHGRGGRAYALVTPGHAGYAAWHQRLLKVAAKIQAGAVVGIIDGQLIQGLPAQCQAQRLALFLVEVDSLAAIFHPAIDGSAHIGQLSTEVGHLRQVNDGLAAPQSAVARGKLLLEPKLAGGRPRVNVDGPTGGVAPIQGALGAAQHLDALYVGQLGDQPRAAGNVDAVQINGDGRVLGGLGIVVADPTNVGAHGRLGAGHFPHRQVGHTVLQVANVGETHVVQPLGAEGRHGNGGFLQGFGPLLCGDDHLFEHGCAGIALGQDGTASGQQNTDYGLGQGMLMNALHSILPRDYYREEVIPEDGALWPPCPSGASFNNA